MHVGLVTHSDPRPSPAGRRPHLQTQALEPFQVFCIERRELLHSENPQLNASEITSLLSQIWRSLKAEEKTHYISISREYSQTLRDIGIGLLHPPERMEATAMIVSKSGSPSPPIPVMGQDPPSQVGIIARGVIGQGASAASYLFWKRWSHAHHT